MQIGRGSCVSYWVARTTFARPAVGHGHECLSNYSGSNKLIVEARSGSTRIQMKGYGCAWGAFIPTNGGSGSTGTPTPARKSMPRVRIQAAVGPFEILLPLMNDLFAFQGSRQTHLFTRTVRTQGGVPFDYFTDCVHLQCC